MDEDVVVVFIPVTMVVTGDVSVFNGTVTIAVGAVSFCTVVRSIGSANKCIRGIVTLRKIILVLKKHIL